MKSILLTTTALVAFAGAAAADGHAGISFSGSATLGYNDTDFQSLATTTTTPTTTTVPVTNTGVDTSDDNVGFYWDAELDVTATAALDNGVTATASFGLNVVDNGLTDDVATSDYVLSLASENASLSFGDVDPVAEANWGGVDGATADAFNDQDVHFDTALFDAMLVGEVTVSDITAMISYGVDTDEDLIAGAEELDALQLYASGDVGMFSLEAAYQQEFADATPQVFGLSGSTTFSGAEITLAYVASSDVDATAADEEGSSIGIGVSYPVTPAITVGAYYSVNDPVEDNYGVSADYVDGPVAVNVFYDFEGGATGEDTDDTTEIGLEGSYDVGNGLTVLAGYISTDAAGTQTDVSYVAGVYDLGGGAELLVSYAMDDDETSGDEVGDPEYQVGTTVEVSFSF